MSKENFENLIGEKINLIITGSSGWIGKATLEFLYAKLGRKIIDQIFAISSSSDFIYLKDGTKIPTVGYNYDFPKNRTYVILHFAFLTRDKLSHFTDKNEYFSLNKKIRDDVTKIINQTNPKSLLYASSGAVYDKNDDYGILKSEDEKYFQELALDKNFEIIIPRIFNIAGPHMNKLNLYALSDFINQSMTTNSIRINANVEVVRSYIHIYDLLKICLSWILDKNKTEKSIIFDTANKDSLELSDLAKLIVMLTNSNTKIIRNEIKKGSKSNLYVGDNSTQQSLCERYKINILDHKEIVLDTYSNIKHKK